jgi:hypothetical protein
MKTLLIIFFTLFILYSIKSEDKYSYDIKSSKDSICEIRYCYIYKITDINHRTIIDSFPLLDGINSGIKVYIYGNNFFYFHFYASESDNWRKTIFLLKDTIRNDSVELLKSFKYLIGYEKNCDCIFDSIIATITCDSVKYQVDLLEMKLK